MEADGWRVQMESIVRTMVQPLVADGGRFQIESCDPTTKEIMVRASMAECEACQMSDDDLAELLQEAVQRTDPQARVRITNWV